MIDIETADKDIEELLKVTLHMPPPLSPLLEDFDPHDQCCQPYLCEKAPHYQSVRTLVANLSKHIHLNNLKPGTLLLVSSEGYPDKTIAVFLGVVVRKLRQHVVIEASVDDSAARLKLYSGSPRVFTSEELFMPFVIGNPFPSIFFEAWKCQAFMQNGELNSTPDTILTSFEVTTTPIKREKGKIVKIKLPFGMDKALQRQREKHKKKNTGVKKKTKTKTKPQLQLTKGFGIAVAKPAAETGETSAEEEDPSDSSSALSDLDQDEEIDPEKESERMAPVSEICRSEQKQIKQLAEEIETADHMKQSVAESLRSGAATSGSSFFSRELGLHEGGIAASARSVCLHCKSNIPKGSVRFSWYYSKARPHGWVHGYCLYQHAKQNELMGSTKTKLSEILRATAPRAAAAGSSKDKAAVTTANSEVFAIATKVFESLP